ncbi:glycoside hydrolase family 43 protein [Karstenula rhodostoma CBS 690.94]|uniref:Glycoside hydrolase family 43 protein n=1 Tax=Karstenula rhodostoma CBS 690.94 TaxID=1392251 RepID=A0A9P4U7I9_9PLEO|nr:glycoside hydrolase family 43 protein [Karstenula rhodostoma CBS 690.94]
MILSTIVTVVCAAFTLKVSALKNPLIRGWNPDPHVLRVEDTYYIAVSSFNVYPGIPIYKSKNLADWELVSHAINRPNQVPLYSSRKDFGIWAPSLTYIDGTFYMTSMSMWGSDAIARTWPRIFWITSKDLKTWSDPIWADPYGIDPHFFHDPATSKDYLTIMGLNNGYDQAWGISQCQVDLESGKCGGTGVTHRASIARSKSPEGPWESSPTNPLVFNGANTNLTIGNTGHATFSDTPDGKWFATLLAKRYVGKHSPLGRETFFAPVTWKDGWPTMNGGKPLLMSQSFNFTPDQTWPPPPFEDTFSGPDLATYWYQLRTPYTKNYRLAKGGGVVLIPNVFTLSDRDTPAAILRKQLSVNMTFTATLLRTHKSLNEWESIGISAYQSESNHQEVGLRGCANSTSLCLFTASTINGPGPGVRPDTAETPLNLPTIPKDFQLHIRSEPKLYKLGFSRGNTTVTWVKEIKPDALPSGFDGAMFGLFASGNSLPWEWDGAEVGFRKVREVYGEERYDDYIRS